MDKPVVTVACLGLAFKPDIDDLRESPALEICSALGEIEGLRVLAAEPHILDAPEGLDPNKVRLSDMLAALHAADVVVGLVAHSVFRGIDRSLLEDKQMIDNCSIWCYKPHDESGLDLLLMLSLGRSGSTFLAQAISESSAYQNAGENRYFWQELVKKPAETHPAEITRFFTRKCPEGEKILDKTPELYRHLADVNFGPHRVRWIELKRAPEAIEASRANFLGSLLQPKRWMMRIRKYRRDYGVRWYVPIMQRWFFLGALLGFNSGQAFSTNARVANAAQEREVFDVVVADLRKRAHVVTIDYDAFDQTVPGLTAIGFSQDQIDRVHSYFKR